MTNEQFNSLKNQLAELEDLRLNLYGVAKSEDSFFESLKQNPKNKSTADKKADKKAEKARCKALPEHKRAGITIAFSIIITIFSLLLFDAGLSLFHMNSFLSAENRLLTIVIPATLVILFILAIILALASHKNAKVSKRKNLKLFSIFSVIYLLGITLINGMFTISNVIKMRELNASDGFKYETSDYADGVSVAEDLKYGQYILESEIIIKDTVDNKKIVEIDSQGFSNCDFITSVQLGENVLKIGTYAFRNCSELKTVVCNKNLETINQDAFNGCEKLERVVLENKLGFIGNNVFYNCELVEIEFKGTIEQWRKIKKDYNQNNVVVHCTDGDTFLNDSVDD